MLQRAEACAQLAENNTDEKNSDILEERIVLPPISKLKYEIIMNNKVIKTILVKTISVPELMNDEYGITTLSVNDNSLLVSSLRNAQVYRYSKDGIKLSTFAVPVTNLWSVAWLNNSQLICTSNYYNNSIVMSEASDNKTILTTFKHGLHIYVSMSKCNVFYFSDYTKSLYKSEDAGKTWSVVFNLPTGYLMYQAIPVRNDNKEKQVFWTRTKNSEEYLKECTVDKQGLATWRDIELITQSGKTIQLGDWRSMMVYDDNDTIFVSCPKDNAVYAFLISSGRQIDSLSITEELDEPSGLALDNKEKLLYIGNKGSVIKVFHLVNMGQILVDLGIVCQEML